VQTVDFTVFGGVLSIQNGLNLDAGAGEHTIAVRVEDEYGNQAV
jgi:hypothetical protein